MNISKFVIRKSIFFLILSGLGGTGISYADDSKVDNGKFYADFNLRYEHVSQDNPLEDADAVTLRSRLGYKSAAYENFSFTLEAENTFALLDDYSVPPTGHRTGQFSVVADPEGTEIDQAFVQYKGAHFSGKLGRQVLMLDDHRFVGHVGWRQDRQTFDGLFLTYKPDDKLAFNLSYLVKRNRIFSDEQDIDSQDMLLNSAYQTKYGTLVAYAYLLEQDIAADNGLDTFGLRFTGKQKSGAINYSYEFEYASQEANDTFDADYVHIAGGLTMRGATAQLGYELLGSDGGEFGFSTPLATLHKFNGWADVFLATPAAGLQDVHLKLSGKVLNGKLLLAYHDFSADQAVAGADNLGSEVDLVFSRKFSEVWSGGAKLAAYQAGDASFGKVDTDKFWLWAGAKF